MKRKEVLIAVISGCIGAMLTMAVGLFSPMGARAHSQPSDAVFGKIQCKEIEVVDSRGRTSCWIGTDISGGRILVNYTEQEKRSVSISATQFGGNVTARNRGGTVRLTTNEHGGEFYLSNSSGQRAASISIDEHGSSFRLTDNAFPFNGQILLSTKEGTPFVAVSGPKGEHAEMTIDEHGGRVEVSGKGEFWLEGMSLSENDPFVPVPDKDKKVAAMMRVNKEGNGTFSSWDENGNPLK